MMMIQMTMLSSMSAMSTRAMSMARLAARLRGQSGCKALGLGLGQDYGEIVGLVGPFGDRRPAACKQQQRAPRGQFVAVLGVDRRARCEMEALSGDAEGDVAVATRCISIRDKDVVPARFVAEGVGGISPSSSRLIRSSRFRLNAAVPPSGRRKPRSAARPAYPVHADQQLRAGPELFTEMAQQVGRAAGHEIADGRAGKEAEVGQIGDLGREANGRVKSATTGSTSTAGKRCCSSAVLCSR